ncbi:flagellar hook-basal body complex protein FliE [Parvibium lacunae]|uniref:Flagellar hook-basal body complex protein FliE n=2 Tax=Parvibium lacunae TaxID=1888893 RepID=A0A368L5J9_9BURK|nr:flagellar hook-basal body complex protein FliE [Parvibium lacunae]
MRGNAAAGASGAASGTDFSQALKSALDQVNSAQTKARELDTQFQMGNPAVSLEETVLASQSASLGFQTLVSTRNRLVAAYNEIMNMQV